MDFVLRTRPGSFDPNADVFVDEENGRLVVVVEVAGADSDALRIHLDERNLVITGRRIDAVRLRRGSFAQKEIAFGPFYKRIALPAAVEYDGAAATYADGLLVVALPLAAAAYRSTAHTELHIVVKRIHS
ncbi:MAG TPA: Hsp20/alpha crystallin family protein [Candidatus Acidoferrales bacterium]|nr:Hsp20/alpha crystallin family protein [Candidatus Acidoferrales bacterium]